MLSVYLVNTAPLVPCPEISAKYLISSLADFAYATKISNTDTLQAGSSEQCVPETTQNDPYTTFSPTIILGFFSLKGVCAPEYVCAPTYICIGALEG